MFRFTTLSVTLCLFLLCCGQESESSVSFDSGFDTDDAGIEEIEPEAFISRWTPYDKGDIKNGFITLPFVANGEYDFTVSWGDGDSDTITAWNDPATSHGYSEIAVYEVRITGTIEGWSFRGTGEEGKILEILNWGPLSFGNTLGQFQGCHNLTITAEDSPDLSSTMTLQEAFSGCSSLTTIPTLGDWDISSIRDMNSMFLGASSFDQDIIGWDMSGVDDIAYMFSEATAFNGDITSWDTSNIKHMHCLFWGASSFNQNISSWDVSQMNMGSYMFADASSFNQDISTWDISNMNRTSGMFKNATSFDQDLSDWDISNVWEFGGMFEGITLSTENYDAILVGWESQDVHTNLWFSGGFSQYSPGAPAEARQRLIDKHDWHISDGGEVPE